MDISEETFIINLGIHLRQLREKKNMSQQDLANDCSIPIKTNNFNILEILVNLYDFTGHYFYCGLTY